MFARIWFVLSVALLGLAGAASAQDPEADPLPEGIELYDLPPDTGTINFGLKAKAGAFPSAVVLAITVPDRGVFACTGSLIAPRAVLTAGHCVSYGGVMASKVQVSVRRGLFVQSRTAVAADIVLDPQYRPGNSAHDIAVIRLPQPFTANSGAVPVRLATAADIANGFKFPIIVGWGTYVKSEVPLRIMLTNDLLFFPVRLKHFQDFSRPSFVTEGKREVNGVLRSVATCFGDSGGPVYLNNSADGLSAADFAGVLQVGVNSTISPPSNADVENWTLGDPRFCILPGSGSRAVSVIARGRFIDDAMQTLSIAQ